MIHIEIKINIPEEIRDALLALAEQEEVPVDEIVNRAIRYYLEGDDTRA